MAESGAAEPKQLEEQCPDTGQTETKVSREASAVSTTTGDGAANGEPAAPQSSPKSNLFLGVRPPKFMPGNVPGTNPFIPRPTLKADVVTTGGTHPVSGPASSPAKFVLRPSALSAQPHNMRQEECDFPVGAMCPLLKPAKLPDPTKPQTKDQEGTEKENKVSSGIKERNQEPQLNPSHENLFAEAIQESEREKEREKQPDSSSSPSSCDNHADLNNDRETILGQNLTEKVTGVHTSPKGMVSSTGFVFGENLADRVLVQAEKGDGKDDDRCSSPDSTDQAAADNAKTLEESAREYQLLHGKKTELQEVEVFTGEENESNVLQTNGKLFIFDGEQKNWVERGRGLLRLNDMRSASSSAFQSRLLMRTQGSLRLILNTKIWPGMTVERASQKSVRLTATDGEDRVKVFLLMTNPKDNENILRALDWRIQQLRYQEENAKDAGKVAEKRKAEPESPTDEFISKKTKKAEDDGLASFKREESDSSVLDPETEASSESHASSFTLRTDSD